MKGTFSNIASKIKKDTPAKKEEISRKTNNESVVKFKNFAIIVK